MNNTQPSAFEEKVYQATRMPEPPPEFASALWEQMTAQPVRRPTWEQRIQGIFVKPAWALTAGVLLVLLVTLTLVGPQRVLAALQGVLGYVPGVGFVSTDSAVALREPVEMTQNGHTVQVEQLLSSSEETVLVLHLLGFPSNQDVGLGRGVSLQLVDGRNLFPGDFGVESSGIPGEYTGVYKFQPLPEGTRQVVVNWKPSTGPEKWETSVNLFPISDSEVAKILPKSYEPADASSAQQGITLKIDQVSSSPSDTAVRIQMIFPEVFDFASPETLSLVDDLGNVYHRKMGQIHFEDQGQSYTVLETPGPTPQIFKNLHETLNFPAADPAANRLTLQVDQLSFRASPYVSYSIDLGPHPAVGDSWEVGQVLTVGDLSFRVNQARLVALDKNAPGARGQTWVGLVLDIEPVHPDQVQINQIWLRVWGAQQVNDPSTNTWSSAWLPNKVPTDIVDIHLDGIQGILNSDWNVQWDHHKP